MGRITIVLVILVILFIFPLSIHAFAAHYISGIIQWKSVPGVAYYHIYYKESGAKNYNYGAPNIPSSSTQYTVDYLHPGVSYEYMIVAFNSSKNVIWKSERRWIWKYQ